MKEQMVARGYITASDAARKYGVRTTTIYKLANAKRIKAVRVGHKDAYARWFVLADGPSSAADYFRAKPV